MTEHDDQELAKGRATVKLMANGNIAGRAAGRGVARRHSRSGFSIIELLVAIIIIGILVAVLVPVVSNRAEQARIARVNSDLQTIGDSLERVAVDTGYFVRLFALNDVLRGDGVAFTRLNSPVDRSDGLTDYSLSQPFLQFPTSNSLFVDPATGDFVIGLDRTDFIDRLLATESSYDGSVTWGGPYMNFQKDSNVYANVVARDAIPDDPWGNDYMFFTREGLVLEPNGVIVDATSPLTSGGFGNGGAFDCEVFDRPTVVSLGPNGLPGNGIAGSGPDNIFGGFDDYFRQFGR